MVLFLSEEKPKVVKRKIKKQVISCSFVFFFPQRYQLRMISTIQRGFRCWVARWGQQFSPWDWYNGGYGFSDHHLGEDMDVSKNRGTPKSSHFNRVFHYKPSILGYPYVWKHPYNSNKIASSEYQMYHLRTKTYKNNNF